MIVSKSQSQATLPEERSRRLTSARLAIASFIIHHEVAKRQDVLRQALYEWGTIRPLVPVNTTAFEQMQLRNLPSPGAHRSHRRQPSPR